MKLKRIMAFTLAAGLMMSSMTVLAANYDGTSSSNSDGGKDYVGATKPTTEFDDITSIGANDTWTDGSGNKHTWDSTKSDWVAEDSGSSTPSTGGSSGSVAVPCGSTAKAPAPAGPKMPTKEEVMSIVMRAEATALQATARDEGFANVADMQNAAAKNMSVGEYYNNAVVEAPGIEEATPVAQGSGIIINGVVTNAVATINKVDVAFVDSVRASVEGTVLNVVDVQFPAVEATINFYLPGVAADANIAAVQYVDGAWVDVEVAEVRADHVVLNLKQNGKVAFLTK